jgi:hypothetical protein
VCDEREKMIFRKKRKCKCEEEQTVKGVSVKDQTVAGKGDMRPDMIF